MKKTAIALISFIVVIIVASCSKGETYADQKNAERAAISKFISKSSINVISEAQFANQGYTTDTTKGKNQYVLLDKSGVYMQIIRNGCGEKVKDGENVTVLCRFDEYNIKEDSMQLSDNYLTYAAYPEKMNVTNSSGTFTASFDSKSSLMYLSYGSTSVPAGWLVPLTYINIGRPLKEGDEIAKVKLIVPHSEGQSNSSQYVYPCYYKITYMRGI